MPKTWLTVVTALVICLVSLGLMAVRRAVLGPEIDGTPGTSSWQVSLEATGEQTDESALALFLPPDFRRQHIADERFDSPDLVPRTRIRKGNGPRRVLWQRRVGAPAPGRFHLTYSCRAVLGMRRPTAAMASRSQVIDAPPPDGALTRASPRIESDDPDIADLAGQIAPEDSEPDDVVRSAFDHVVHLGSGPGPDSVSARTCLLQAGGDPAGKARLVVALCRNRGVPARLVQGLALAGDGPATPHAWAEAWVQSHWLPVDPTHGHFGARRFPGNYLVLHVGDDDLLQGPPGTRPQLTFRATDLHNGVGADPPGPPSLLRRLYRRLTPGNLRPEDQQLVQFLLLLPVAALVVCVFRVVIGLTTYGTFGPALLGLVCRDLHDLPWALGVFVLIMLGGWGMRRVLDSYHLLMVPRVAVLLTGVIGTLVIVLMLVSWAGLAVGTYLALLPLIILTHMVERFWTLEAEDGTAASFKTLVATIVVAATVSLVVNGEVFVNGAARLLGHGPLLPPNALRTTLLRYPEALGLVLAAQLLLGRYTGYRLTELYRFKDLLEEEPTGGPHDLVATRPGADGPGHPGDEPAQHRVHPRP